MIRILIAIATLFAFAAYTGHARAENEDCISLDETAHSPAITGDPVKRAVAFYNSLPGDDLSFAPDSLALVFLGQGRLQIIFVHKGLNCGSMIVDRVRAPAVLKFIMGVKV